MRFTSVCVLAMATLASGCLVQPSLEPFVGAGERIAVPEIVGTWTDESEDPHPTWTFAPREDGDYTMTIGEGRTMRPTS